jgi:hypothetical protein
MKAHFPFKVAHRSLLSGHLTPHLLPGKSALFVEIVTAASSPLYNSSKRFLYLVSKTHTHWFHEHRDFTPEKLDVQRY